MRKIIGSTLAVLALVCGIFVGTVATEADATPAVTTSQTAVSSGTPWGLYKFAWAHICVENNIGTLWDWTSASNAFESGSATVIVANRNPGQSCSDYDVSQRIRLEVFSDPNQSCWLMSYHVDGSNRYDGTVTIWMNISSAQYSTCRPDDQRRDNVASRALGTAFGLANFYSDTAWQASIMNAKFSWTYHFAGVDDRNSLWELYKS